MPIPDKQGGTAGRSHISYDAADRISAYTHLDRASGTATAAAAALNQGFAYDELGRLLQVNTSVGNWVYTYDDNGNRTSVQLTAPGGPPNTRLHTVAATSNRLLALNNPPRTLAQDATGNTWADQQGSTGWTASHDLSGRLTRIRATSNGTQFTTTAYVYDTAGQRVLKQPLSSETCTGTPPATACRTIPIHAGGIAYVHGPNGQLLGEYNATTGAPIREYLWLQDLPLAVVAYDMATSADPAPVYYIHTDHLNTPRVVLDRNGAQRWSWMAEPFGNSSPNTSPVGLAAFTLNLRMPGQVFDAESGLLYNWNRTYDAGVGRYTQSDPIGLAGGISTYAYVGGNPLSSVDPSGLDPWYRDAPWESHPFFADNSRRSDIVRTAVPHVRSKNWSRLRANPTWKFIGAFKCNIFVNDVLNQAGEGPGLAPNGYPWLAQDWWSGSVPGFERVPRVFVRPGDIAVQLMPGGRGYSGHVGIVVSSNETVSQSSVTNDVDRAPWAFRPHERDSVRFYRCTCE